LLQTPDWHVPPWVRVPEVLDGQFGCEQVVPLGHFWQPPLPSHLPVFPQLAAAASGGQKLVGTGSEFSGVAAQVPTVFTLHAWHDGHEGVVQQTPSTQLALAHWLPAPHVAPGANLPTQFPVATPGFWQKLPEGQSVSCAQPATVQVPVVAPGFWQKLPAPHWASAVQWAQPEVVQMRPVDEHVVVLGGAHAPGAVPVQWETAVKIDPLQEAVPHGTVAAVTAQAPLPSQTPVCPQGALAVQRAWGSATPGPTGAQVPDGLHVWHKPQLVELQQTLSTQFPVVHSCPVPQVAPGACFGLQVPPVPVQKKPVAQSVSALQTILQAVVPLQRKPLHDCVTFEQSPPAQEPADVSVADVAGQLAAEHTVPFGYFWHPPAPSHLPLVPQLAAPWSVQNVAGACVPGATGEHIPGDPATLQAWHPAQLLDPQQTPSTHAPLMHWLPVVHARPLAFSAQLLLVPVPWQVNGDTQSVSATQVVLHALVPHTNGVQGVVAGTAQAPAPVQWEMGVKVDPVHEALPQLTLALARAQAPAPLHRPVLPHGGAATHRVSEPPAAMLAQVPGLPVLLHCWQVPQVAVEQQTPSTQKFPVRQSVLAVQA
jgi:hypothetical protein